jgi:hypothetical protein
MIRRRGWAAAFALLLALSGVWPLLAVGGGAGGVAGAQQGPTDPYYFEETGHYLSGRFRQYWEERGGLYVFGFPLTKVYNEVSTDGNTYLTQYFERARFEYHPENRAPFDVLLTLVGNEVTAGRRGEPAFQPAAPLRGRGGSCPAYFEPTGHNVQGPFCEFWVRYGGLQNFGFALSEEFPEVNSVDRREYTVQYFERGRWEYHPELAGTEFEVLLGLMGLERMNRVGVDVAVRARETSPPTAAEIPGAPAAAPVNGVSSTGYPFLKGPRVGLGLQVHYFGQPRDRLLALTKDIGFTWTKQQVVWRDIETAKGQYAWGELDAIVNDANAAGIKILLSVVKSPKFLTPTGTDDGTPRDPRDFGDFMRAITTRYKGKVAAYELWNEANLAGETGNRINPGFYVELLEAGYLGVKSVDPTCIVVLGALSPTGVNDINLAVDDTIYLEQLFQYNGGEVRNYYDVLGAHPYGMSNPPETLWSEGNPGPEKKYYNDDSFYFRRFEAHHRIMERYGDGDKQIWLTEWGWGSDFRPDGYDQFNTITEEMRADYVVRAIRMSRERYPWMGVMFHWNLNWSIIDPWYTGPAHHSIINADYSPRPVYNALKALPK